MKEETKRKPLTEDRIEKLAIRLFKWCVKHGYWVDTTIYFNGKSIGTYNPETKEYYYDQEKYYMNPSADPSKCFEYPDDTVMCIITEGAFNRLINCYAGPESHRNQVRKMFHDQGLRYVADNCYIYATPMKQD